MIVEPAPAKLNLALHIRRRRPDGYHDLDTLFAFARHGDTVALMIADDDSLTISGPYASALTTSPPEAMVEAASPQAPNLVALATDAFRCAFGVNRSYAITLDKHLPVASGIGGGSADAAATLRALARLHDIADDDARLVSTAASLGADVPACLVGRTARGAGRGDELTPLPPLGDVPALLVNPNVAVSTAQVFGGWDGVDQGPIAEGGPLTAALHSTNGLTDAAIAAAPLIADVLAALEATTGHRLVRMSGSGATCFALYEIEDQRTAAATTIRRSHPGWWCLETTLA